jgi:hypothetical protein
MINQAINELNLRIFRIILICKKLKSPRTEGSHRQEQSK